MSVKYVEFHIEASGFGCVNTNGNVNPQTGQEGTKDGPKNHVYAKQRNGQMYISSNCLRGYFFEKEARGLFLAGKAGFTKSNDEGQPVYSEQELPEISQKYACSYLGLVRGYMLPRKNINSLKRDSPLMMTDWKNQIGRPNKKEVMINHLAIDEDGNKDSNSFFSADTWGDTLYSGDAVLSIEKLQFLALDNRLGQQSVCFSQNCKENSIKGEIDNFQSRLIANIKQIGRKNGMSDELCNEISAEHGLFIKPDTLFNFPETGILLNNHAIHALVLETLGRLSNFSIIKSKGFVKMESVKAVLSSTFKEDKESTIISNQEIPDYACFYQLSKTSC